MTDSVLPISRDRILADLVHIISDVIQDWDIDPDFQIDADTKLIGDLAFQSIDVVMLVGEVHKHYQKRHLPFEKVLLVDGHNVSELQIGRIVNFLFEELNAESSPNAARAGEA